MPTWNIFRSRPVGDVATRGRATPEPPKMDVRKRTLPPSRTPTSQQQSSGGPVATFTVMYTRHHGTGGLSSRRSVRSNRSRSVARSGPFSTRSRNSKRQPLLANCELHMCYVCNNDFHGDTCKTCETSYDSFWPGASEKTPGVDLDLMCDLANSNDFPLLQAVVASAFSDMPTIVASFFRHRHGSADSSAGLETQNSPSLDVDMDTIATFYDILSGVSSSCAMRAVLHGASVAMCSRPYGPMTQTELAYILALLQCPIFTQCSMFTKLTGPMQKLERYASFRMPARVLLEKCVGLLANCTEEHRNYLVKYFGGLDKEFFSALVQLLNGYVGHRLSFLHHQKSGLAAEPSKKSTISVDWYCHDWRLTAVVKVLSVLFTANLSSRYVPVSAFYNTMVDKVELHNDFDRWFMSAKPSVSSPSNQVFTTWPSAAAATMPFGEQRFYFCRFPFILSIAAKARVFDHTVRREVDAAMRKEVFSRLAGHSANFRPPSVSDCEVQIRRTHVLSDSLAKLDPLDLVLRMNLRVHFTGEPAIDAGGPRREWLTLLIRELLNPERGLFIPDETSNYRWLGTADRVYYSVTGIALGLALRNSITLDIDFPHLLFKRLLNQPCTLDDLQQLWPAMAQSVRAILEYDGDDFSSVFDLAFTAPNGEPLIENGDQIAVTQQNKEGYVELLIASLIETPQFDALRKGFYKVIGGASLALYHPEELDYLLRGDRDPIDVHALQAVTRYSNFGRKSTVLVKEPVVIWFWEFFACLDTEKQALLLAFVTASDRMPAMGVHTMTFRIVCLGGDSDNLPTAHTCFNQLGIYRYSSREKFEHKMLQAMNECSGFGIR